MITETSAFINEASGTYRATRPLSADEICLQAKAIIAKRFERGAKIGSPSDAKDYFVHFLGERDTEAFCIAYLDNLHQVIKIEIASEGTISHASVYPREIIKRALQLNAAALIVAHNHPCGISKPSEADRRLTRQLKDALTTMEIRFLDHFVIGAPNDVFSFAETGQL